MGVTEAADTESKENTAVKNVVLFPEYVNPRSIH
jgi:hypothetical protein